MFSILSRFRRPKEKRPGSGLEAGAEGPDYEPIAKLPTRAERRDHAGGEAASYGRRYRGVGYRLRHARSTAQACGAFAPISDAHSPAAAPGTAAAPAQPGLPLATWPPNERQVGPRCLVAVLEREWSRGSLRARRVRFSAASCRSSCPRRDEPELLAGAAISTGAPRLGRSRENGLTPRAGLAKAARVGDLHGTSTKLSRDARLRAPL